MFPGVSGAIEHLGKRHVESVIGPVPEKVTSESPDDWGEGDGWMQKSDLKNRRLQAIRRGQNRKRTESIITLQ